MQDILSVDILLILHQNFSQTRPSWLLNTHGKLISIKTLQLIEFSFVQIIFLDFTGDVFFFYFELGVKAFEVN